MHATCFLNLSLQVKALKSALEVFNLGTKEKMLLKLISSLFLFISISFISVESQKCSKGCGLALASYYIWPETNLTFISEVLGSTLSPSSTTNFDPILKYNSLRSTNSLLVDSRLNIPFPCDCINGEYFGHVFQFNIRSGDTYDKIATEYYANLTTVDWLMRFNIYPPTNIPATATVNVTVNCSCWDASISTDYGLFITYPLRPGETFASVMNQTKIPPELWKVVQSYNQGNGLVYVPGKGSALSYNAIIGLAVAASTIMLVICFCIRYLWERQWNMRSKASIEKLFKEYGSLAPERYSYSEIRRMTHKFKEKLGQGGYGSVFKGKLPDGRLVAVKLLSESKGNGDEFMNEVASISTTSHVNIVTLIGFCYERSKRALVYEFVANGSLDKFIYNQGLLHQSRQLGWETLYDIALGIARGLAYLHHGCKARILHFDIKPHNILLDESFCPKISDFGLSKFCKLKESIISITGARGTAGYIAPEVFCRNFGEVSYKSDVYSYGMMVLEMVGGRKNYIDVGVSKTSEIYFPSLIYKNLDQATNLKLQGVTTEEEEEIARKLIVVSLWCIQSDPSDRPSMSKVLEMLQGNLQSLPIPPKPFASSPVPSPETTTSS